MLSQRSLHPAKGALESHASGCFVTPLAVLVHEAFWACMCTGMLLTVVFGSLARAEWSKGVSDVLGVLRGQMLWQLEQELTTPRPDALLHSSNLQSLCAITIAGEAMLHKNSLPKIVGDLQQALEKVWGPPAVFCAGAVSSEVAMMVRESMIVEQDEKPQPEQEEAAVPEVKVGNEVMAALLSFGYNERVIELVAQLHPMPSTFATPEGEQVLDNLMASNLLTLEVQELEERVAQKRKLPGANAGSKEDEKELEGSKSVAMEKLQGLAALTQVLKAVHLKQPLPPAFVDHCKTEILHDSVLKTWDDTDFSSGMLTQPLRSAFPTCQLIGVRALPQGCWSAWIARRRIAFRRPLECGVRRWATIPSTHTPVRAHSL